MIWTALYAAWHWLPYVVGGSTTLILGLAIAAAAGVSSALSILNKLLEIVTPLGVGASNFIVWLFGALGKAVGVAFANPVVFLLLFVCGVGGAVFVPELSPKTIKTKAQIAQCQKENTALKKSAKPPPRRSTPASTKDDWSLSEWFR